MVSNDLTTDTNAKFDMIEGDGYRGQFMLAFGTPEEMRAGRDLSIKA
jgi:hypothetical protein